MKPAISLNGVTKRYGDTEAVKNVSLTLHEGEFIALLGASGCGKSTSLRLLAGLERPSEGHVELHGKDVSGSGPAERNIALMFQSYALYPHLSVFQNIAMPLRLRGLSGHERLPGASLVSASVRRRSGEISAQVQRVADMLRLDNHLMHRKPGQLSGGQQQRVALARALVRQPTAFLLDEPLSNLDTQLRAETRDEIRALHQRTGCAFLLVTHDQSDALSMADRVAVMIDGEIVQTGSPEDIFCKPGTIAVAEFIGQHRMNIFAQGAAASLHPAGARLTIGVRPEQLHISTDGKMKATVEGLAFHGEETILKLRGPDDMNIRVILRDAESLPGKGQTVRLSARAAALHGFDANGIRQEIA